MAQNPSNIIPDQLIVVEGGKQLVPAPSSGDSGKVLGVLNSNGDIGWTEDRGGMAQQQADWAETDSSKVTYIANKPSGQMAPTSTSSDSGKVLKVDAQGAPVWGDVSGVAEFLWSTVTRADVDAAMADGKMPVILDDTFRDEKTYCYLYNTASASPADTLHFASIPVPGIFRVLYHEQSALIWVLSFNPGGVKSRTSKHVAAEITSDNSITLLDYNGKLKITVTNPLPASAQADSGKVLTVNASGNAEWANASAGTAEFSWSTVTKNDVETALTAGKSVVITYATGSESIPCYYTKSMTTNNGTEYTFVSQALRGTLDSTNQNANVVKLVISGTGAKTQTTVPVGVKLVSDGSITIANGANAGELSITTNAVPASTSSDENKVLTVNASGVPEWATAQGGGGGNWGMQTKYISLVDPNSSTQWRQDIPISITGSNDATVNSYNSAYQLSQLFSYPDPSTGVIENGFGLGCTYILSGILPLVPPVATYYDSLGYGILTITDQVPDPDPMSMDDYTRTLHKIPVTFRHRYLGSSNYNAITATEFQVVIPPLNSWVDNVPIYEIYMEFFRPSSTYQRNWRLVSRDNVNDDLLNWFRIYCTCIPTQSYVNCDSV